MLQFYSASLRVKLHQQQQKPARGLLLPKQLKVREPWNDLVVCRRDKHNLFPLQIEMNLVLPPSTPSALPDQFWPVPLSLNSHNH